MTNQVPAFLQGYVPAGHRLWFSPRQDPDAGKPKEKRNANANGGLNRRDWIVCQCGASLRLARPEGQSFAPSDEEWLDAINQCRLSVHSTRKPCLPIDLEGKEQPLREAPPSPEAVQAVTEHAPKRAPGRPKKALVEA